MGWGTTNLYFTCVKKYKSPKSTYPNEQEKDFYENACFGATLTLDSIFLLLFNMRKCWD
jgi:hypothetical protein